MDFTEIQKLTLANAERYSKKHNIDIDLDWLLLKLTEKVESLPMHYLYTKRSVVMQK